MVEKTEVVIVDTYAIIADLTGQAPSSAVKTLDLIRTGEIEGLMHYLIIYELAYHWRKRRLPFRDEEELLEFVNTYFKLVDLSPETAVMASQIKIKGDSLLRNAKMVELKRRKLSVSDAITLALALKLKAPIITGDSDLSYVAEKIGVKVIW